MAQGKLKLDNAASYASELKDINPSIVNDKFLEKNKEIEVDVAIDNVSIVSSKLPDIDVKFFQTKKEFYELINEEGIFRLKTVKKNNRLGIKRGEITIFIPDGMIFNKALMNNISGDLKIANFNANEIIASSVSGNIIFENTEADAKLCARSVSGDIAFNRCKIGFLKVDNVSGDIVVENSNYIDSSFNCLSGDIDVVTNNNESN